ncbi:MAG: glycoside hydrolase [Lentisphaerales bacterium]|nr:glycoside hydrolase [Lentisphaerales bacterium]
MKFIKNILLSALVSSSLFAKETAEDKAKNEEIRAKLPLGDFSPKQEEGIFVAAGHGLNVVVSRDDGKTWQQSFIGRTGGDHGYWAVWNNVAYTNGVFAIASGWSAPGTIIATDDGANWKHLTSGKTKVSRKKGPIYNMGTTMNFIAAEGSFIMQLSATPDLGKTWFTTNPYSMQDENGQKAKANLGHASLAYGDGRVWVLVDAGPSIYSDDLGKTWVVKSHEVPDWSKKGSKGFVYFNGAFLLLREGEFIYRSTDKCQTWEKVPLGIERPASRSSCLSVAGGYVWATGITAKKSKDGINWEEVPQKNLSGIISASEKGTLINVSRKRQSILRSTNGGKTWQEVYTFSSDGKGGAQGLADVAWGKVKKVSK